MKLRASHFDYPLEESLIAQKPVARGESRLMTLDRASGHIADDRFDRVPELLRNDDLLVLNDTRVIPAGFTCRRKTGGRIEGLFLREHPSGRWEVLLRSAGRCKPGETLDLVGSPTSTVRMNENLGQGRWSVSPVPAAPAAELLDEAGVTPLPPYIHRADRSRDGLDRDRYQTLFADRPGSVAAPTAGLHFSRDLLDRLDAKGIGRVTVTLHVGLGTFAPVKCEDLSKHRMHREWYELGEEAASALNAARAAGRRIVAVGTTSLRVLETLGGKDAFGPCSGMTDLFIYPPADFHAVGAMITNFHLPRSTLLMLVSAFCCPGKTDGLDLILGAYRHAIRQRYRFYSYGDAMLIE